MVASRSEHRDGNTEENDDRLQDPMALTWTVKYNKQLSKIWNTLPDGLSKFVVTLSIFVFGVSINGDWLNWVVHLGRQFGYFAANNRTGNVTTEWTLESFGLKGLWSFLIASMLVSYGMYYLVGGFITWYWYIRQRDNAHEWKCQPTKWLTPELERHEIMVGSMTMFVHSCASALLACYVSNGGYSTIYYGFGDYGWLWFFLQWPVIFIYQDYTTYWLHRIYHTPFFYKRFHKLHHKYKHPTVFSVTAIHPVESLHIQLSATLPIFVLPIHWFPFYAIALYVYYHGILDHSGVNLKAHWWQPWQPDAIFHDNHHQYFHVNFGFNMSLWDKLHGTYRQKDRVYSEEIFYGKGKSLKEATAEELSADLEERDSENLDNKAEFKLSEKEVAKLLAPSPRT